MDCIKMVSAHNWAGFVSGSRLGKHSVYVKLFRILYNRNMDISIDQAICQLSKSGTHNHSLAQTVSMDSLMFKPIHSTFLS